jgi:hypothetical protein
MLGLFEAAYPHMKQPPGLFTGTNILYIRNDNYSELIYLYKIAYTLSKFPFFRKIPQTHINFYPIAIITEMYQKKYYLRNSANDERAANIRLFLSVDDRPQTW